MAERAAAELGEPSRGGKPAKFQTARLGGPCLGSGPVSAIPWLWPRVRTDLFLAVLGSLPRMVSLRGEASSRCAGFSLRWPLVAERGL